MTGFIGVRCGVDGHAQRWLRRVPVAGRGKTQTGRASSGSHGFPACKIPLNPYSPVSNPATDPMTHGFLT